jgi:phosphotransferase system enzyme I (PtsP)
MYEHKLTTLELISSIIANSHNLSETLKSIVLLVQSRVKSDVCSIYLTDDYGEELVLKATIGLNQASVNNVRINIQEGLVGESVRMKQTIAATVAKEHPAFKYIPETNEEKYTSLLATPLFDRGRVIGVLVIQTKKKHEFDESELKLLNTIAGQVSLVIVNAKLLEFINSQKEELQKEKQDVEELIKQKASVNLRLTGISSSKGVAVGYAHYYKVKVNFENLSNEKSDNKKLEWERYLEAAEKSKIQLVKLELEVSTMLSEDEGKIFQTHLLMLEDTAFHNKISEQIDMGWNAETAVKKVVTEYANVFKKIEDEYLKERITDIKDVANRLVANLLEAVEVGSDIPDNTILIAKELSATDIATLDLRSVKGILLEKGGAISHSAILAKSYGIPVVSGLDLLFSSIKENDLVAMDGTSSNVYVNPNGKILDEYRRLEREFGVLQNLFEVKKDVVPSTKDGSKIIIGANVGLYSELDLAKEYGAKEIGLYRTEFAFSIRSKFPTEEEQYIYYKKILGKFNTGPVTFRILDIGGDKFLPYYNLPHEGNPFLGYKSIRILFEEHQIFKDQLKGILRASVHGEAKMMFPMVSSLDEIIHIGSCIEECMEELDKDNVAFDKNIPVGIMLEVPSAVKLIPYLSQYIKFFSIGTNDLIQYLVAVDRNNRKVAPYFTPLNPAVLLTLKEIFEEGDKSGLEVSMCGEMAGNFLYTPLLLGLGLRRFHMAPSSIPAVKVTALEADLEKSKALANFALTLHRKEEIKKYLNENHPLNVEELSFHDIN